MSEKTVFTGELNFLPLPDIFQMLGGINCTGILRMSSKHVSSNGQMFFVNGNPVNAVLGHLHGLDAVYAMFGWTDGKAEFITEKVQVAHKIKNGRMEIVLEAMRLLDEGEIKIIGPASDELTSLTSKGSKDEPVIIRRPIVDYMCVVEHEKFTDRTTVVKEGGHGTWIWIILEGVIRITKKIPTGEVTIARLGDGCFIGNLASFSIQGKGRTASGIVEGNATLGVLDSQVLSNEYSSLSHELKGLFQSLDGRVRKITQKIVDIYMKKDDTDKVIKHKKVFMKEGSIEKETFIITEGEAYLIRRLKAKNFMLMTLGKGDFLGYVPFLEIGHEPQNTMILASNDFKVEKLDLNGLQEEYNELSGTLRSLIENVAATISLTTIRACQLRMKYPLPTR